MLVSCFKQNLFFFISNNLLIYCSNLEKSMFLILLSKSVMQNVSAYGMCYFLGCDTV